MDIQTFHRYNNLVADHKAKPLLHSCGQPYVTRITEDNDPVLACVWCDTLTQPGLALYKDILAVVKEHYV